MTLRRAILSSLAALLLTLILSLWGCSQFADSTPATKGSVITSQQLRAYFPNQYVICGDTSYAEVNPEFATKWHDYMGSVMSLLGMATNWTQQFDCNRFVNVKLAVIHIRFLVDTWHARNPGQGPAAGEFWYLVGGVPNAGHAIIVAIEGGQKVYRDIYTANRLYLTPAEEGSAFLIKF